MNQPPADRLIAQQPSVKGSFQSRANEDAARAVRVVLIKDGVLLRPGARGAPR